MFDPWSNLSVRLSEAVWERIASNKPKMLEMGSGGILGGIFFFPWSQQKTEMFLYTEMN